MDGDGALQSLGASMRQGFDAATALQDAMPVFNAPAQAVPAQTLLGLLDGRDFARRQQKPLKRLGILWRIGRASCTTHSVIGALSLCAAGGGRSTRR